ncbi:hypothetical protein M0805_001913 [Coniferiporia weirii]|nr:hypothetical protein M0805_001913 [Coniferiporia weirii]
MLLRPAASLLLSKPFKCPKPGYMKSYKQANGLKYHVTHGQCNFTPPPELSSVEGLSEREVERRLRPFCCQVPPCQRQYICTSTFVWSTDEEAMKEDEAVGEKEVIEEKHARRSARHHAMKAIETFSVRRRTAPSGQPSGKLIEAKSNVKPKMMRGARRVSLGGAIDVETGESVRQRQSRRKSTIVSLQSLHSRLKDAEECKASMPKHAREIAHTYTQAELIARVLDAQEGNIIEHCDYLMQEEEKRRRAWVVRQSISGPVLHWVSCSENEKVPLEPPASSTTILIPNVLLIVWLVFKMISVSGARSTTHTSAFHSLPLSAIRSS